MFRAFEWRDGVAEWCPRRGSSAVSLAWLTLIKVTRQLEKVRTPTLPKGGTTGKTDWIHPVH